jgi:hypothetical protein
MEFVNMYTDLNETIKVTFNNLFLDPNNPRMSPQERPGYEDPETLFFDSVQEYLYKRVAQVYNVKDLEDSIISQGWVPVDQLLVWEHPKAKGKYIILEGNTRKTALKNIRERLGKEQDKLERMKTKPTKYKERDIKAQENFVYKLKQIISATDELEVIPIKADTPDELEQKLPRLLTVRHIAHAQAWSPYATNLYILSLYDRLFQERYGSKLELRLEPDLIEEVGKIVSLGATKVRRSLQAASAFSRFQRDFEDQLSEGDSFKDEDQYYFETILQNRYAQEQFRFTSERLHLDDEMAEVLFKWAFQFPRGEGDDNKNILRKAKDIALWSKIKKHDDNKGTAFAAQLDVEAPDNATSMNVLEAQYQTHKVALSPIETVQSLLDSFTKLTVHQLQTQADHFEPMLEELHKKSDDFLRVIHAVAKK